MSKKILVICAHPLTDSFCGALADAYQKGARTAGAKVKRLNLGDIRFDINLKNGYKKRQSLEDDLKKSQEMISWADHLVWIYPTWWFTFPALLKGFIDRVFIPGFAFSYHKDGHAWDGLLSPKSARLITTMDAPPIVYKLIFKSPGYKAMKAVLNFCGVKRVKGSFIGSVKDSDKIKREKWIKQMEVLGNNLE